MDGRTDRQTYCHGIVRDMHTRRAVTRAAFKYVLRYCRRHREQLKADAKARDLLNTNLQRHLTGNTW